LIGVYRSVIIQHPEGETRGGGNPGEASEAEKAIDAGEETE
jgi:hypothetical protein